MTALSFMTSFSTASRLREPETQPEKPKVQISEQWDGKKWVEHRYVWDGEKWMEEKQ